ncbi:MAG: hypothetical protein R8G01_09155 [Ilumatobacteraceae bacterium]|nr:hypothetical protein [Ilumatobacteraceae bacterium]
MSLGVSLCITSGGRPDLLRETLRSLLPYNGKFFDQVLVTNDRGDAATDEVVRQEIDDVVLLTSESPIGQHRSIDKLYSLVETPYVFHCEDDWAFDPVEFIPHLHAALEATPDASGIWARQTGSIQTHLDRARVFQPPVHHGGAAFVQYEESDPWSGYSFSPHLLRVSNWRDIGPYEHLSTEGAVNAAYLEHGLKRWFLVPGVYYHLGDERHLDDPLNPLPSMSSGLLHRIRRRLGR